jgi:hypothetical protein
LFYTEIFIQGQQMEALREYATREGYEVLEEVTDPGQSGGRHLSGQGWTAYGT